MSSRRLLTGYALFMFGAVVALPALAHATGLPFFGPIVQGGNQTCAGNFSGLIQTASNLLAFAVTMVIVFIAPLMIAYAGFLMVFEPASPGGHNRARTILINLVIGIVVALSAWLIVNMVLVGLTAKSIAQWTSGIFNGGPATCLPINVSETYVGQTELPSGGSVSSTGAGMVNSGSNAQCASSNMACSPSALESAGLGSSQANVMSCIAVTESSGNPSTPPYNQIHSGSNSTACGTFQITQTTWNGMNPTGACSDWASSCENAACNARVATMLVSQSGYSSWTCPGCNSKASSCVSAYSGG